jgi:hypothetical protein
MIRSILVGVLLVAVGAAAASLLISRRTPASQPYADRAESSAPAARGVDAVGQRADGDWRRAELEQRVARLESKLAEAVSEGRRLQEQLDSVAAQLAGRIGGGHETDAASAKANDTSAAPDALAGAGPNAGIDYSKSAMERALAAAGLDASTAADIKLRHDTLAMNEMYLRDQATREQWVDTPRFAEEMSAIDSQRTSIRDEIGDDAYDRYLFALGQTNRVRVDDVMAQSPAAQAGLQTGDMILRYGDTRVFGPDELVAQTRDGTAGESVRLEIMRNGQRLEVDVPRGPLGLRIAATQDTPGAS